ncbi:RecG-like helicase [Candidatus Jidaibacter acanthamoeba]|uniref:ATP-dependent DNA helicase RecG n=1 Tax=Candidatus Jidaibacter acanthamoebae TaxID=86105 RepID=A0A0C1N0Q0_9RICK|nr:ATP-dependent DNA helicase RecG [Candidatus Jidaibacter acanthamoeba]KIE05891.1 RecG-like helicase [Candidatus Jidaibacter acanthamoeba]
MPNPLLLNLFWEVRKLKNIGSKRAEAYHRLGLQNIRDLIFYFPYQIIDRRYSPALSEVLNGTIITEVVTVEEHKFNISRNKRTPQKVICSNETGKLTVIYFNANLNHLKETFRIGRTILVSGKVEYNSGELQMVHPDIVANPTEVDRVKILEPVYHSTYGLNSRFLNLTIQNTLKFIPTLPEWLPQGLLDKHGWISWLSSLQHAHHPEHIDEVSGDSKYKQRLAFDELLATQLALSLARKHYQKQSKPELNFHGVLTNKLYEQLPFDLTDGQKQAISEIESDQKSPYRMARLVLGDVGCGKTLVALCAMLNCVEGGKQAALMAPTEVLAKQHFAKLTELCEKLELKVELLISKMPLSKRKEILENIANHKAHIVIGTHALFQENVQFAALGLAVIDEQHRFGVEQRASLSKKGIAPDFLMMSATPIPRTLCMVNYGDLDLSIIKDKPAMRELIQTSVISSNKIPELLERIKGAVESGEKIYWICPLIEESESLDLSYIEDRFSMLNELLPTRTGIIHGKMHGVERDKTMLEFLEGKISVLVATTVIEVGVDVSDATIMVIENAERFGLSQLHQLRGRVGRGNKKSHCILVYKHPATQTAKQRLNIMKGSNDGFVIAEEDLKIRGSGEILGTKQSGLPSFRTCNLNYHYNLIPEANALARKIAEDDPDLKHPANQKLKLLLELYEQDKSVNYIKNN